MKFDAKKDEGSTLHFDYRKQGNTLVIALGGSMDSASAPNFTAVVDDKLAEGENQLIVNLDNLNHLSSAGLRSILVVLKKIDALKRKMYFVSANEDVNRIFKMAGVYNSMFSVYESEEAVFKILPAD
ncbi:STAS domain-containing protein [Candidatus Magnetominusculus dajiuhuensis]|uniref:STAS domain-containing protein n=1 Tax=Candidatus Magnetominusculus dajiuhuensis TaxID=3137712 RepID=UPI003B436C0A